MKIKYLLSLLIAGVLITLPSFSNAEIIETRIFDYPDQTRAYNDYITLNCPDKGGFANTTTKTDVFWDITQLVVECSSVATNAAVVTACADMTKVYNPETKECEPAQCWSCEIWDVKSQKCEKIGIKLNTDVPFIGDCIAFGNTKSKGTGNTTTVNQVTAFPTLMGALMNIVMTATLIIWFLMIVVGGVLITTEGMNPWGQKKGKAMIVKVGAVLAILGLSGVILKLINPTFFT